MEGKIFEVSMSQEILDAIEDVVEYNWKVELKDFSAVNNCEMTEDDECNFVDSDTGAPIDISDSKHIFRKILIANNFVSEVKKQNE